MRIFYDTEFLEDGTTIEPISWGGVREDGKELYVIMADAVTIQRAAQHPWLRANVLPHLPVKLRDHGTLIWEMDSKHPDAQCWTTLQGAASKIAQFVLEHPDPQLWAWYGAYDHVMTAQLFGRMIDLPEGFPMHTCDLKQEADRLVRVGVPSAADLPVLKACTRDTNGDGDCAACADNPDAPCRQAGAHNALHDAREVKLRAEWLDGLAKLYRGF